MDLSNTVKEEKQESGSDTLGTSTTEHIVRIPQNRDITYNIRNFNPDDNVDFSTWKQAYLKHDCPPSEEMKTLESGAGRFGKKDQSLSLQINGRDGKILYGKSRNMATEDGSYYIFKQRPDGDLDAFLVQNWYDFTMHSTPTTEEAKAAWSSSSRWGGFHTERKSKTKPNSTDTGRGERMGITEALEDSDDSDDSDYSNYEGLEVDCSSEEELENGKPNQGEAVPKGIEEASESEEEEYEEDKAGRGKTRVNSSKFGTFDSDFGAKQPAAAFMLPPCGRGRGRGAADGSRTGRSLGGPPAESATTSGVQTTLPAAAAAAAAASNRGHKKSKRQTTRTKAPAARRNSRNQNPRLRKKRTAVGKSSTKGARRRRRALKKSK
ncbi:general transcription factor IIF subunit 1-like isoform X2 [Takifugu flavidus]|uniref:general transcription factor IIF subunit 1-like isoform X2 n=1 Tax=Takifugu flavidus TaxID=433684 RepID=UPI002544AABD|nr:general transcription factor IIF subunit 1-like isoform X2 [Takifugu flavidus]